MVAEAAARCHLPGRELQAYCLGLTARQIEGSASAARASGGCVSEAVGVAAKTP